MDNRTITDDDVDAIVAKISEKMTVVNFCPLDESSKKAAQKWYAMMDDMGNGNPEEGIRRLRKNLLFVDSVYQKRNIAVGASIVVTVSGLLALAGKIFLDWLGK